MRAATWTHHTLPWAPRHRRRRPGLAFHCVAGVHRPVIGSHDLAPDRSGLRSKRKNRWAARHAGLSVTAHRHHERGMPAVIMADAFDAVLAQALKLTNEDRRALVAHLLETFEPGYAEYDSAWGDAIQRRLAAIAGGSATIVPWPAAREQIDSDKMRDELGKALDVGIAELDRGQGIESSIDEFMAEVDAAVGLTP